MLLPKDINPSNSTYFNGALILDVLLKEKSNLIDFFDLFFAVKLKNNISMKSYVYALDWLFLLGSIKFNDKNKIVKCF